MSQYQKQFLWKQSVLSKTAKLQEEQAANKDADLTFAPTFYTAVPVKTEETNPRRFQESGQTHIDRQQKARREREEQQQKLVWKQKKKVKSPSPTSEMMNAAASSFYETGVLPPEDPGQANSNKDMHQDMSNLHMNDSVHADEFGDSDEEAIVETLERERREWHKERVKLIHCIHMQQIELSQRAISAQDRAAEIAKDFAQVIASFEERLVSIEENVQKEIMAVKTITGSLTNAVATLSNALPQLKQAQNHFIVVNLDLVLIVHNIFGVNVVVAWAQGAEAIEKHMNDY